MFLCLVQVHAFLSQYCLLSSMLTQSFPPKGQLCFSNDSHVLKIICACHSQLFSHRVFSTFQAFKLDLSLKYPVHSLFPHLHLYTSSFIAVICCCLCFFVASSTIGSFRVFLRTVHWARFYEEMRSITQFWIITIIIIFAVTERL